MEPQYSTIDANGWTEILNQIRSEARAATSVEQAAQAATRILYENFKPTTSLVRVYTVIQYGELPTAEAAFVDQLVAKKTPRERISKNTPVLVLVGSSGKKPTWCDRRLSQAHRAIPLSSAEFVHSIPMVSQLLRELGIDLTWLDEVSSVKTLAMAGGFNGLFYVEDASRARDALGRSIIPAHDFVMEQGIKTVFGMGGFYADGSLLVCIVFTRETLNRTQVERLGSLISLLKGETFSLMRAQRVFG